ncbi:unnamed protein product [Owenia fusiformis]|uniref:phosphoinositide 5-phosphatase n=1 Tax=Owenia fusiformis TaxID=6347 RepID=A0A8S4PZ90_OWEFU|nr:unnamed protein product [Owenia fusiformis]
MSSYSELKNFIQLHLGADEKCTACIQGELMLDIVKVGRVLAIVTRKGDHGLFVYTTKESVPTSSNSLQLEVATPINAEFKYNIDTEASTAEILVVGISNDKVNLKFQFPKSSRSNDFFTQLKKAIDVHSQSAAFGLPPSYSWISEHYPVSPEPSKQLDMTSNWFTDEDTKPKDEAENQFSVGFEDNFSDMPINTSSVPSNKDRMASNTTHTSINTARMSLSGGKVHDFEKSIEHLEKEMTDSMEQRMKDSEAAPLPMDKFIRMFMAMREAEYTDIHNFKVFCGTWNTNGQAASADLKPWLSYDEEPPDIYALGFQELDLSKEAFLFAESPKEDEWFEQCRKALHPSATYKKLKLIRLVGMMLIVFVKKDIIDQIRSVSAETVGTGIMGMMGNKGGVSIRLDINSTSICFVNCHLAAHTEEYERRNQDFRDINSRMSFRNLQTPLNISDHDIVYWIGDLNYRLSELDVDQVKKYIELTDFKTLLEHDQLHRQHLAKKVFLGYREGDITFQPTYKYDTGTDNWDTSEKCRAPAWCDRVLFKGRNIKQLEYRSHPLLRISDHKPVSALFEMGTKVTNTKREKQVLEDVLKKKDKLENEFLPAAKLDKLELKFENVQFIQPQEQTIEVTNVGQVPLQFEFINKLNESRPCKPWLSPRPTKGFIMPNDSLSVEFEVYIDKNTAPGLNTQQDKIEDILVLHLEGGKDFFVSVTGNYIPSTFGSSIEALVHMYSYIRDVSTAELIELESSSSEASTPSPQKGEPFDIPKELWRLVDHLNTYGLEEENIFQMPGLHSEIQLIRDCLDTGVPEAIPGTIHSVAEALLIFIESLSEPVIPYDSYQKCLDASQSFIQCKQVLQQIPISHRNVFKYVTAFLRKLLQFKDSNLLDVKFLAQVFGGFFLRSPTPTTDRPLSQQMERQLKSQMANEDRRKSAFMYHFLTNDYDEQ